MSDTVSGRSVRVGDGRPPFETRSSLQGLSIVCEIIASLGNDGLEGFKVWDVFVDDGLVDGLPKVFCGLKLGGVGRKEDQPDSLGNRQVAFAMPTGVVEHENDDAIPVNSGFLSECRQ